MSGDACCLVQAISSDSRPSDARSSVEGNKTTPTSLAPEVGLVTTLPSEMIASTIEIQGPPRQYLWRLSRIWVWRFAEINS